MLCDSEHKTESDKELLQLFPVYATQRKFISVNRNKNQTFRVPFQQSCCDYVDPKSTELSNLKQKYVMVEGMFFHSNKFIEGRRREIRQIFQFGPSICSKVEVYGKELFGLDNSHKFCVHIRRGDFIPSGRDSKKEFTEKGIIYGYKQLTQKFGNVSMILMGMDRKFIKDLVLDRELIPKVYYPEPKSRGEDMAFASTACNSLLITAFASTFTWWIAYLMPENSTIFYNSAFGGELPKYKNYFLPEWIPIKLVDGLIVH